MPDAGLRSRTALEGWLQPGRFGNETLSPGLVVNLCRNVGLATVIARRGRRAQLASIMQEQYGIEMRRNPRLARAGTLSLIGSGPDHWLAMSPHLEGEALCADLTARFAEFAAVIDQTDSRAILRLWGPRVREVLTRGAPIDVHPRAFATGDAVSTLIHHIGVQIWQIDDQPTFVLAVARSLARSLWGWLLNTAAQFGVEVLE